MLSSPEHRQDFPTTQPLEPNKEPVSQILARIENLMSIADENETGLDIIQDRLEGQSQLSSTVANGKPAVPPSHIIFTAKRIEQLLESHLNYSRNAIQKIVAVL